MNKYNKNILKNISNFELVKILKNCMFHTSDYNEIYCPQCPLRETLIEKHCDRDLVS